MITVVVKQPGEAPEVKQIDGSLESIQKEVGGLIEQVRIGSPLTVYCNEEGLYKYMAPNIIDDYARVIVGPVLVMKGDNGLTDHQAEAAKYLLEIHTVLAHG